MKHNEYFRKFPLTSYNGTPCLNILRRVGFDKTLRNYYTGFTPFSIGDGMRIEEISYDLYGDVDLDWLIYQANDIIDPYYGVPLDTLSFETYIKKKFGSIAAAQRKVYAYRNNWRGDESILSVTGYNALDGKLKRLYEPAVGNLGMTLGYTRKEEDDTITTNQIISISFASEQSTLFEVGEMVTATSGSLLTEAEVVAISKDRMILQHIEGNWSRTANFSVRNDTSTLTIELNYDTYKLLQNVIDPILQPYYKRYSNYQFEQDVNERKRDIMLVNDNQVGQLNKQLDDLMK